MHFSSIILGGYSKALSLRLQIIMKIEFEQRELPRDSVEIGKRQYVLSEQTREYLIPRLISPYPRERSIIIINEPHNNSAAQYNTFRGLESFFSDNSELVSKTAFLAEGHISTKPISAQPLTDKEPFPNEEMIKDVLRTFLITGYIACEWKNKHGIPIFGTEDPSVYTLCREFARLVLQDPNEKYARIRLKDKSIDIPVETAWKFLVTIRNKAIARTVFWALEQYENPILFTGGLHLGHMQEEAMFDLLKLHSMTAGPLSIFNYDHAMAERIDAENVGLFGWLLVLKIGFTFFDPKDMDNVSHEESKAYLKLFETQSGSYAKGVKPRYKEYIDWLFDGLRDSEKLSYLLPGTTVETSTETASKYIYERAERKKSESPNWFSIGRNEVQEKLGRGTIWDEPPIARGRSYEQLRGANIGGNYPIVDDINDYAATSMKTLDFTTAPYQNPNVLGSTVRGYIDSLSGFSGPQHKYLELGIPAGRATPSHVDTLCELQTYAGGRGITLAIGEVA